MRIRMYCLAAAMWLIASTAAAQGVLTEADALVRLSTESPQVRAIQSALEIAGADALAASRWPNPRLTYDRESVAGVTEHMTTVIQPLPITGRRGLAFLENSGELLQMIACASQLSLARLRRLEIGERQPQIGSNPA